MAYKLHKEETPQLRIKMLKSNQQTALTRELEKTWLLSRAQRTLQVSAMSTETRFPQTGQIIQNGNYRAASPPNPQKQRNGGK